ncbi:nuclear transport factor 2 family protein [Phenylobacterium sp. LjRoot225]|uniref:nuclear transport factor 2 family protein n=1 Tax=Phenylobacterium sp. LjRoot225 TaxID=3342285 RepID=UPI003ECDD33C
MAAGWLKNASKAAAVVAVATLVVDPAFAQVVVAGGALDSGISGIDVYLGQPVSAEAPAGRACQAAKAYVALVNAGRYADIPELFEAEAIMADPGGPIHRGRSEIRGFFEGPIRNMRPEVVAVAYVGDDADCMVELANRKPVNGRLRWVLASVDHFTLAPSGKISRMVAFARMTRPTPPAAAVR